MINLFGESAFTLVLLPIDLGNPMAMTYFFSVSTQLCMCSFERLFRHPPSPIDAWQSWFDFWLWWKITLYEKWSVAKGHCLTYIETLMEILSPIYENIWCPNALEAPTDN
uniref:Secreted protein n=1 Tax=Steinernema glaseri TaxID=37863 RepID=A0A1I7Z8Y6_9BILA